jgi:HEAT repeat protein
LTISWILLDFLEAENHDDRSGNRYSMDYYLIDSQAGTGVIFTQNGVYLCEEARWNEFLAALLEAALPELKVILLDPTRDHERRVGVAHTLSWVVPSDTDVLDFLIKSLTDDEWRNHAVYGLASMGRWARPAVPALLELLSRDDDSYKGDFIDALGKIGDDSPRVISALIRAASQDYAKNAANALGALGPGARAAVPALEALLRDENEQVQEAAREALRKIRGP